MQKTGELAKLFGIDRTTLNYYVKNGMIRADTDENQYHTYTFPDFMALAHIRFYRGLGFSADEISRLLGEDDHQEKLDRILEKHAELQARITRLRQKQCFLESLQETLTYFLHFGSRAQWVTTEPYYFIRRKDLVHDPEWMELYRMVPYVELVPRFNPETGLVEIPDPADLSGVFIREVWVKEFSLQPPPGSIYYPKREQYIVTWTVPAKDHERILSGKVRQLFEEKGDVLDERFVVYLLLSQYKTDSVHFEAVCFFHRKA